MKSFFEQENNHPLSALQKILDGIWNLLGENLKKFNNLQLLLFEDLGNLEREV